MGKKTKKWPGLPSAVKYPGMWKKMDTNSCFPQPMGTQTLRLTSYYCPACCVHRVPHVPWSLPAPTPLPGSCLQIQLCLPSHFLQSRSFPARTRGLPGYERKWVSCNSHRPRLCPSSFCLQVALWETPSLIIMHI